MNISKTIPKFFVSIFAIFSALTASLQAQNTDTIRSWSQPVATISFELTDDLIYLPVSVNGSKPMPFVLDGGSSVCIINPVAVKQLALATEGAGTITGAGTGKVNVTYVDSVNYNFGTVVINVPKSTVIDLSGAVPGHVYYGLIGYELFEHYVVEINFQKKEIRLFDPPTYKYAGRGSVLPITIKAKRAFITGKVKVAGHPAEIHSFLIDTGSSDPVDDSLIAKSSDSTSDTTGGVGIGQTFKIKIGYIESFQFGKYTTRHIKGVTGAELIGNGFLHDYLLVFDYSRHQMMVEKQD